MIGRALDVLPSVQKYPFCPLLLNVSFTKLFFLLGNDRDLHAKKIRLLSVQGGLANMKIASVLEHFSSITGNMGKR